MLAILGHDMDLPSRFERVTRCFNRDLSAAPADDGLGRQLPDLTTIVGLAQKTKRGAIGAGLQQEFGLSQVTLGMKLPSRAQRPLQHAAQDRHHDRQANEGDNED